METRNFNYSLDYFNNVAFNGFQYIMPNDTVNIISELALEVGAPTYVKTPIFQKSDQRLNPLKDNGSGSISSNSSGGAVSNNASNGGYKKRKGNKHMESNDEDWETMRNFQSTKIEKNTGIACDISVIRTYLNKLTDKNYDDLKNKVCEVIEQLLNTSTSLEDMLQVSTAIFEIASTNRFYSTIYANLYTDIIKNYEIMKEPFENGLNKFLELFDNIEYVDPSVDYDKFCKINKDNEKRKALSSFFINLMNTGLIQQSTIIQITRKLLNTIYSFISLENKKNEVDELAENIAILYKKEIYTEDDGDLDYEQIDGLTITEVIEKVANSSVKDYSSLTKKTIFKFMDLVDM